MIGAGVAGILTAYHLINEGKKVALIEGFNILNGTTGNTTAKLSAQHGLIYSDLIKRYGVDFAKSYYEANMLGIETIQKIAKELELVDIVGDETMYAFTREEEKIASFKEESEAYQKLNIKGEYLEEIPLQLEIKAALSMKNQGTFHPVEFLNAVLKAAVKKGLKVYEHSLIMDAKQKNDDTFQLKDKNGNEVKCNYLILTTHYPLLEKDKHYTKLLPRTTQALAFKTNHKLFDGAYIAYDTPSVTLRTMEYFGDHYFLIGGQSHTTGDGFSNEERYEKILEMAQKMFDVKKPEFKWSTHDLMTPDHVPFIGRLHPDILNAYTITGLNAWGLANSSAGALLITDLICKRFNRFTEMYNPYRKIVKLESDEKEEKSSSKVSEVDKRKVKELQKDQMTQINQDEKKVGVYKDVNDQLHYLAIQCTHLGCDLEINDGDQTWDCPCHGSRFDKYGKVIYGPAVEDLKKIDL